MAQRISQYQNIPYAQEALPFSSVKRGLGAMTLPNPGIPNMMDGGNMSKPSSNAQEQRNYELSMQNLQQNAISAQPQAVADAIGQARNSMATGSTQEARAQQFMNVNLANQIEASQTGGAGVMTLNNLMEGPMREKFVNDIAVSKAMNSEGQAPELGRMMANVNRGMM